MAKKFSVGPRRLDISRLGKTKGSVLFFVIAIMSVLIIMASAVYYAVNSATQEVQIKYANEQAYQSAIAINDMVSDYIAADPGTQFISSAMALGAGESIVTNINDLGAGIGNVKVTITKISGTSDSAILSITTESEVNGQMQVVTSVGELTESQGESKPASITRFFTSTGYVPNDTLFTSGEITSELYLDSEYTELAAQEGSTGTIGAGIDIRAGIVSAGSVRFNNAPVNNNGVSNASYTVKNFDITIGNDCYFYFENGKLDLGGGTLRVGGSVVQLKACYAFTANTQVYIQGDLYSGCGMTGNAGKRMLINGDLVVSEFFNYDGEVYVNGDVYVDQDYNQGTIAGKLVVGGNVYVKGDIPDWQYNNWFGNGVGEVKGKMIRSNTGLDLKLDKSFTVYQLQENLENIRLSNSAENNGGKKGYTYVWPSGSGDANPCESMDVVTKEIRDAIGTPSYINWQLEKMFHVGQNLDNPLIEETEIVFPFENWVDTNTVTLSAAESDKYVISTINVECDNYNHALVFDTSDGAGGYKDIYVYLKPNINYNKTNNTVTYPEYAYTTEQFIMCKSCGYMEPYTGSQTGIGGIDYNHWWQWGMDYPESYTCPDCGQSIQQFTGRSVTSATQTGSVELNAFQFGDTVPNQGQNKANNTQPFHVLVKGKGSVIFVIPKGETFVAKNQSFIGHYAIYEEIYGDIPENNLNGYTYKPTTDGGFDANWTSFKTHLDPVTGKFDQYLLNKTGDSGTKTYIHNNVFMATVEKNVDVDFDIGGNGQNFFAGLIYAPYMQYNSVNSSGARTLLGGLVVSNYNIQGSGNYTYAAPYDYYDRFVNNADTLTAEELEEERQAYLAHLMGQSGSNSFLPGGGSGTIGRAWNRFGYN
ncbi:MAG: hypothetical protein J1E39_04430 [Eubacterium sp.]|nr:hypothetical protein [Eubacterium sp.]